MSHILGTVVPVLVYGVLCAYLGAWVNTTIRNHWKH